MSDSQNTSEVDRVKPKTESVKKGWPLICDLEEEHGIFGPVLW